MHRIFVFETLKKGFSNHYVMLDKNNGEAIFQSFGKTKLKYPLVVATQLRIPFLLKKEGFGNNISGEIYNVDDKMLQVLDEFENHPHLLTRTEIEVTSSNDTITCGAYILINFKKDLLELPIIDCFTEKSGYLASDENLFGSVLDLIKESK